MVEKLEADLRRANTHQEKITLLNALSSAI
jgi:hypothetical protein